DADTGWAVGQHGTILQTFDGGDNWNPQSSGTSNILRGVYFTDASTGWVVGDNGTILHTTTGGFSSVGQDFDEPAGSPKSFSLSQNHPNPFNPETIIRYDLARPGRVTLKVYNLLGQEVGALADEFQGSGAHSAVWDGKGKDGKPLASGVYFYRLVVEKDAVRASETRKMLLLK
ncbi:MAG: T9SS type A sorting domain-containing protein, partial [Candidatus Zixiibacteriota bacterium]